MPQFELFEPRFRGEILGVLIRPFSSELVSIFMDHFKKLQDQVFYNQKLSIKGSRKKKRRILLRPPARKPTKSLWILQFLKSVWCFVFHLFY